MNHFKPTIEKINAREIIDSRGKPTVEATVVLSDGSTGIASVPSGASTGIYEAHELRDGESERYFGQGVRRAVLSVKNIIAPELIGRLATHTEDIDKRMIELDGTDNKKKIGANAILSVSLATARAAAAFYSVPLWQYLGGARACRLPVPMFNILNGGAHASNNLDIQEFMIVPTGAHSFSEALRAGCEIYHTLGKILCNRKLGTSVGDEGGYAPNLESDTDALDLICRAIVEAGYNFDTVKIALDAASSEWFDEEEGIYRLQKSGKCFEAHELCNMWEALCLRYPIVSLEDGLDQRDFSGWVTLTEKIGRTVRVVGDDFFVTNPKRVRRGIEEGAANSVLIKPNQIGTLSETMAVISMAAASGYSTIMSHRSGETADSTIADLAVALETPFIKSGAPCRSERLAKYNRLGAIEASLGASARYGSARVVPKKRGVGEI